MRFSRIKLKNWRNFGSVDVALQNRAFLVGPNASGKSNFLDAFRFLREIAPPGGSFRNAVEKRGGVSLLRSLAARGQPHIAVEVEIQDDGESAWRYRLAFTQDSQRLPTLVEEKVWQGERLILDRPDSQDQEDKELLRQTHLEQTSANREFREIGEFLSSVRYFHIVPQLVREPDRSVGRHDDPYGGDFLDQIARTSARTRDFRLRRIQKALQIAVPKLGELKFELNEQGELHLFGKYEHWRPQGAWQTETDFSDGTLRLMGLLWSLLDGEGPLLLEEPELSLHPGIVRYIPQLMRRVQRERKRAERQILLSTHSSELLRDEGIAPDEVLLFIPATEGSLVRLGADIQEVQQLLDNGLTMAEAVIPQTSPQNAYQLALFGE